MNTQTKLRLSAIPLFLLLFHITWAQDNIRELLSDKKKLWKGEQGILVTKSSGAPYRAGQGVVAYYPALQKPRKVALISFYVYDFGKTEYRKTLFGKIANSTQASGASVKNTAMLFYSLWVQAQKASLKATYDIDLVTPDQFTEQQKATYEGYTDQATKIGVMASREDRESSVCEAADGFLPILVGSPGDHKKAEALGLLAKDLGVDAVLVCATEIVSDKKNANLFQLGMYMYGPNPVPRVEGKRYIGFNGAGRQEGNAYELLKLKFGKEGVPFLLMGEKDGSTELLIDGAGELYTEVGNKLFEQLIVEHKCGQEDK